MSPNPFERRSEQLPSDGDIMERHRELLELGKETGRNEEAVKGHYGRMSAVIKSTVDEAGGSDSEGKRQQISDTLIQRFSSFLDDSEKARIFEETLGDLQSVEAKSDEKFVQEVSYRATTALYRSMTQQELEHRFQERIAEKYTVINEALSYKKSKDEISVHLAETRSKEPKEIIGLLVSGMQDLAKVVENDEEVKRVLATSWIAAHRSGRKQLERLGFTIDEPITDEMRELDFALEDREVWTSHMDREDFLQRYKEQEGRDEGT